MSGEDMNDELQLFYRTEQRIGHEAKFSGITGQMLLKEVERLNSFWEKNEKQGLNNTSAFFQAVSTFMVEMKLQLRTHVHINRRLNAILYKWLPEGGQRQAAKELEKLTAKDILGGIYKDVETL